MIDYAEPLPFENVPHRRFESNHDDLTVAWSEQWQRSYVYGPGFFMADNGPNFDWLVHMDALIELPDLARHDRSET